MRKLALRPHVPARLQTIDIVGTGGDGSNSLNISTGTAIVTAACGIPVVKHGNRSVSSRAGSADVLAALGLRMPLDERDAASCLEATGFTFLFAPYYHPAMKAVAPIRAALGVRTVFNILGPLSNPARPPYHLLGAFSLETAQLMAEAISGLEIERAFVVHGAAGWDEPTTVGPFTLFDVRPGSVSVETRVPEDFGLARCIDRSSWSAAIRHTTRASSATCWRAARAVPIATACCWAPPSPSRSPAWRMHRVRRWRAPRMRSTAVQPAACWGLVAAFCA